MIAIRARLADPGGAENRKMLGQHLADVDANVDGRVLLKVSDLDRSGPAAIEDGPHLVVGERLDRISDGRIGW